MPQPCPNHVLCPNHATDDRNYSVLPQPRPYNVPTWPQACPKKLKVLTSIVPQPCPNHVPYLNHAGSTLPRSCPRYFSFVPQPCPNPTSVEKSRFYSFYRTLLLLFINKTQFSISLKLWELLFYQLINNIDLRTPATLKKIKHMKYWIVLTCSAISASKFILIFLQKTQYNYDWRGIYPKYYLTMKLN